MRAFGSKCVNKVKVRQRKAYHREVNRTHKLKHITPTMLFGDLKLESHRPAESVFQTAVWTGKVWSIQLISNNHISGNYYKNSKVNARKK